MAKLATPLPQGRITADPERRRQALGSQIRHPERMSSAQAATFHPGYGRASGYEAANREMRSDVIGDISSIEAPVTLAWGEFDRLVRRTPLRSLPEVRQGHRGCGPRADLGPARARHRPDPRIPAAPLAPLLTFPWRRNERNLYQREVTTFLRV